ASQYVLTQLLQESSTGSGLHSLKVGSLVSPGSDEVSLVDEETGSDVLVSTGSDVDSAGLELLLVSERSVVSSVSSVVSGCSLLSLKSMSSESSPLPLPTVTVHPVNSARVSAVPKVR